MQKLVLWNSNGQDRWGAVSDNQLRHSARDFKACKWAKRKVLADDLCHFAALEGNSPDTLGVTRTMTITPLLAAGSTDSLETGIHSDQTAEVPTKRREVQRSDVATDAVPDGEIASTSHDGIAIQMSGELAVALVEHWLYGVWGHRCRISLASPILWWLVQKEQGPVSAHGV